jgi:ferredoxin-type protein NapG
MTDSEQSSEPSERKPPAKRAKPRRRRLSRKQEQRRQVLRAGLLAVGILALHPLSFLPPLRRLRDRLRPPGSLDERAFLGACIKCGQCVQVCPVEAILLADIDEGLGSGVPFIEPRVQACDFSCDALSCILACPTGALSHELKAKEEVRIGLAELASPDRCRARRGEGFQGLARGRDFEGRLRFEEIDRWNPLPLAEHEYDTEICDLCVRECPIGETALRLIPLASAVAGPEASARPRMTPVVGDACVGCGVCEMVCPEQPSCIVVIPGATQVRA